MIGERVREYYRQQGRDEMKTQHTVGFEAGMKYARKQVLEFLNAHYELGDIVDLEEFITEIEKWNEIDEEYLWKDGVDGSVAPVKGMAKGACLCEDCFGADLCIVCERVARG